jgi:hypothetical protein
MLTAGILDALHLLTNALIEPTRWSFVLVSVAVALGIGGWCLAATVWLE